MPKKKPSKLLAFKPTSPAHPSLLPKPQTPSQASSERSVNELLSQLRRSQGSPAVTRPGLEASTFATQSISATAQPQRTHAAHRGPGAAAAADQVGFTPREQMARRRAARPPPGPRPPPSWAFGAQDINGLAGAHQGKANPDQCRLLDGGTRLPGIDMYAAGSLRQLCVQQLVHMWPSLDADEVEIVCGALSAPLREHVLLCLTKEGVELSPRSLRVLVLSSSTSRPPPRQDVLESWEDADEGTLVPAKRLTLHLWTHMRLQDFSFLTGLALAHSTNHDWNALIDVLPHLPQLTHLDLSHWQMPGQQAIARPDATPDAGFALASAYTYGTNEPARILRRIGSALGSLRWLCLEGCAEWVSAWSTERRGSHSGPATSDGHAWPRHFPCLRTLRTSPADAAGLGRGVLRSRAAFEAAVDQHRPPGPHLAARYSFPPRSGDVPLRVLEPTGLVSRHYEGPQFVVRPALGRDDAGQSTYTLQPARQVPLWRDLTAWLQAQLDLKWMERDLARVRAPLGLPPLAVERAGVDDGEVWIRDLIWRWGNDASETARREHP